MCFLPSPNPIPPLFLEGTGRRAASPRPSSSHPLEPPLLWGDGGRGERGLEGRRKIEYRFLFSKHLASFPFERSKFLLRHAGTFFPASILPPHAMLFGSCSVRLACRFQVSGETFYVSFFRRGRKFRDATEEKKVCGGDLLSCTSSLAFLFSSSSPPLFLGMSQD